MQIFTIVLLLLPLNPNERTCLGWYARAVKVYKPLHARCQSSATSKCSKKQSTKTSIVRQQRRTSHPLTQYPIRNTVSRVSFGPYIPQQPLIHDFSLGHLVALPTRLEGPKPPEMASCQNYTYPFLPCACPSLHLPPSSLAALHLLSPPPPPATLLKASGDNALVDALTFGGQKG